MVLNGWYTNGRGFQIFYNTLRHFFLATVNILMEIKLQIYQLKFVISMISSRIVLLLIEWKNRSNPFQGSRDNKQSALTQNRSVQLYTERAVFGQSIVWKPLCFQDIPNDNVKSQWYPVILDIMGHRSSRLTTGKLGVRMFLPILWKPSNSRLYLFQR